MKPSAVPLLLAMLLAAACGGGEEPEDASRAPGQPAPPGLTGSAGDADSVLRFPYEHEGACPLECCSYGAWTAEAPVPIQAFRADTAPVKTVLPPGTGFRAVDGEVWVLAPGIAALRPSTVVDSPRRELPPRDTVWLLDPLGEGSWRVWDGRAVRRTGPLAEGTETLPARAEGRVLRRPDTRWWVRVEASDGTRGWVEMDTVRVSGMDACS